MAWHMACKISDHIVTIVTRHHLKGSSVILLSIQTFSLCAECPRFLCLSETLLLADFDPSMSEEDNLSGSDAAGEGELAMDRGKDESVSDATDDESDDESGDDNEGEECSSTESEEDPDFDFRIVSQFIDYAMRWTKEQVTIEGLRERVEQMSTRTVQEALLDYNILHHYVGYTAPCNGEGGRRHEEDTPVVIELEVVEYLIEISPDVVHKVDDGEGMFGDPSHPYGGGSYPLHIACFNVDCPVSVIRLLFEKNPSAIEHSWDDSYGLPLNCYLARACNHPSSGYTECYENFDGQEVEKYRETCPAFPSGELDIEMLNMLIDAYPEALTIRGRMGTPLDTLCGGFAVSLELAKMLMDKDHVCLQEVSFEKSPPAVRLIHNTKVDAFPDDLFRYLIEQSPDSLEMEDVESDDKNVYFDCDPGYESHLYVACSNPKMTAETAALIVEAHPEMVRRVYKFDGCLPLHILCQNSKLEEQSAINILNLLVSAYPESVKEKITPTIDWRMLAIKAESPINIADEHGMSFGFCKALLIERTRQSSMLGCNILQTACANKCSLLLIKKVIEDNCQLLLAKDDGGHIALHRAAKLASLDVVKYLAEENEDTLQIPDNLGELPLHKACREGKLDVIEYLMTKNMESITTLNHRNRLPVHTLCRVSGKSASLLESVEYAETVFKMLKACPKPDILRIACICKCPLGMIMRLVEDDCNILWLRDEERHVALHSAAKYASLDVLKYIVQQHEAGLTELDHCRELPLHKACRSGKFDNIKYLMTKNEASVTVANRWNELPLHILCDERCKNEHQLQSVEYVESVFKLLIANPDPVKLDALPPNLSQLDKQLAEVMAQNARLMEQLRIAGIDSSTLYNSSPPPDP